MLTYCHYPAMYCGLLFDFWLVYWRAKLSKSGDEKLNPRQPEGVQVLFWRNICLQVPRGWLGVFLTFSKSTCGTFWLENCGKYHVTFSYFIRRGDLPGKFQKVQWYFLFFLPTPTALKFQLFQFRQNFRLPSTQTFRAVNDTGTEQNLQLNFPKALRPNKMTRQRAMMSI